METKVLEIIQFTDPVCTWCWGSEPVLRTLETRFGSQLKISYVMGGLVKDIMSFYDSYNDIGGNPERSNEQIAKHWLEASKRHGMPVRVDGFKLFSLEQPSTYPQNIAFKAAQMQDEVKASRFLRRIREASAAEAQQTNLTEVLLELASETALDITQFLEDFTNGKAQKAFENDLYTTAQYRAHGFPSFLIKYGDKSTLLRGYQNYSNFKTVINQLSSGEVKENKIESDENAVCDFINKYNSVAPIEVKMALNLSDADFEKMKVSLLEKKLIAQREAGNGYFLTPVTNPMACDIETGICN
jgi:predicted DsbA family dithiol-disulfide isomerase